VRLEEISAEVTTLPRDIATLKEDFMASKTLNEELATLVRQLCG
jgi:hypothetical protein